MNYLWLKALDTVILVFLVILRDDSERWIRFTRSILLLFVLVTIWAPL